jgi:hypothetical protein
VPALTRPQKITFAEMRAAGVSDVLGNLNNCFQLSIKFYRLV